MTDLYAPEKALRRWTLRRTLDVALVLAVAITALRLFTDWGPLPPRASEASSLTPTVKVGDSLDLPGVRWTAPRSVVLFLSSTCPACNANLPFYRQIADAVGTDVQLVAVSTETVDVLRSWLRTNGVDIREVKQLQGPMSQGVTLTPTILLVNAGGRVTDVMIRKLAEPDQAKVIERIRGLASDPLDNSQQIGEISLADLATLALSPPLVLDVRPREAFRAGHHPEARNIPLSELKARAPIELQSTDRVVVDCLQPGATICRSAAWMLVDAGFTNVSILMR